MTAPLQYPLCCQTVTLYHADPAAHTITAGSAATAFLLVIPEKHAAFGRDYTLEPHDRVLAGTGPEVSYTQWLDFTPAKVPGLAAVQYVDCKTAAGQTAHVEAGGWWTRSGSGAHSLSN